MITPFAALRLSVFVGLRQLWERKLLNGIAVGGVALGVLVLISMNGIMAGLQQKFRDAILKSSPHVILFDTELHPESPILDRYEGTRVAAHVAHDSPTDKNSRIRRPTEIIRLLERTPGVVAAAPSIAGMALLDFRAKSKAADVRGIDLRAQDEVTPIRDYVKAGTLDELATNADSLVVGAGLARELGLDVGDVVRATAPGGQPRDLKIVAIFETEIPPIDKVRAYVPIISAQTILGRPDAISRIEVRLQDPDDARRMNDTLERMFGYDGESWQETNANFLSVFKTQDVVVSLVIGAILLLGGFGILAIQIMIVLQKTRDIAILRSVGLRRIDIMRIFFIQGVVVAVTGGVLGDGLGTLALRGLARLPVNGEGIVKMDRLAVHEDMHFYLWGILFACLVGATASVIPAWRASRVEPVEVLRGQIG